MIPNTNGSGLILINVVARFEVLRYLCVNKSRYVASLTIKGGCQMKRVVMLRHYSLKIEKF